MHEPYRDGEPGRISADTVAPDPTRPAASAPQSRVAPVGFTVELLEPLSPGEDDAEDEAVVRRPARWRTKQQSFRTARLGEGASPRRTISHDRFQQKNSQKRRAPCSAPEPAGTPNRGPSAASPGQLERRECSTIASEGSENPSNSSLLNRPPTRTSEPCRDLQRPRLLRGREFCADQSRRVRSRARAPIARTRWISRRSSSPTPTRTRPSANTLKGSPERLPKPSARDWRRSQRQRGSQRQNGRFRNGRVIIESAMGTQELVYLSLANNDQCFVNAWWDLP